MSPTPTRGYVKVDAETGDEVDSEDIIKGYQVSKGHYVEITDEDLEAVPREEIDDLYNIRPYFIAPEGKVGADAFVTIREAIAATGKVALGRLVLTTREHMIALEPRGKGLMGTLLRYPYEVRDEADYFEDIPNIKIEKEMLDLAKHIVQTKSGHFEPDKFEAPASADPGEEAFDHPSARVDREADLVGGFSDGLDGDGGRRL